MRSAGEHEHLTTKKSGGKSGAAKVAARVRRRGFDGTRVVAGVVSVRCSRCAALVIDGVPCHETGCPNAKRRG